MNVGPPPLYRVERLSRGHDRGAFACGNIELDAYLHTQAGQDLKRKVAAVFVMLDPNGAIAGYYTLSAYAIRPTELPVEVVKRLPRYPLVPATLLGRLAISRKLQGQNLDSALLIDALRRSWRNAAEVASIGVVVDTYDEKAQRFYLRHEFIQFADHPNKLFLPMRTIEKALT